MNGPQFAPISRAATGTRPVTRRALGTPSRAAVNPMAMAKPAVQPQQQDTIPWEGQPKQQGFAAGDTPPPAVPIGQGQAGGVQGAGGRMGIEPWQQAPRPGFPAGGTNQGQIPPVQGPVTTSPPIANLPGQNHMGPGGNTGWTGHPVYSGEVPIDGPWQPKLPANPTGEIPYSDLPTGYEPTPDGGLRPIYGQQPAAPMPMPQQAPVSRNRVQGPRFAPLAARRGM